MIACYSNITVPKFVEFPYKGLHRIYGNSHVRFLIGIRALTPRKISLSKHLAQGTTELRIRHQGSRYAGAQTCKDLKWGFSKKLGSWVYDGFDGGSNTDPHAM